MTDLSKEALIQIILELRQANTVLAQTVAALEEDLQRLRNPKNNSNSSIPHRRMKIGHFAPKA